MRARAERVGARWPGHVLVVVILLGFSVALQFSSSHLGSVDGYFHARYASLVRQGGLLGFPPAFPWLPLTIRSADRYYDHHMLFHVLLAPFTSLGVVSGTKGASALFAAAALAAVYAVMVRRGVARAGWWLLATMALAPDFLYRVEMPRVQAVSLVMLLLATELLLSRRFAWLLPLATLYTWLYDAFPLLLMIAGLVALSMALLERRLEWRAVLYPLLGVGLGLLLNPYFPNNVWFIAHHYLGKVEIGTEMHLGTEWYPYPVAQWLGWGGAVAVLVTAAILTFRARRQLDVPTVAWLMIAATFFVLVWRSRRFIEYAAPFVGIALATALHRWAEAGVLRLSFSRRRALAAVLLLGLGVSTFVTIRQLRRRPSPDRYAGGAAWLVEHTPPGAIVFTPNWDDFPLLFFHDQHNRYVVGLDPSYLAQRDASLYRLYQELGRGEATPPSRFLPRFDARVVLSDHSHERFLTALAADPEMERVYEDGDCAIFRRRG
jgi:hypothetical protein